MFVISLGCILNNWLAGWICSALGLAPSYLWVTAMAMPSLVIYNICDRRKLLKAVSDLRDPLMLGFSSIVLSIVVYFQSWILFAMISCAYFAWAAFSQEKALYLGDGCGAVAKQLCDLLVSQMVTERIRMSMKLGEWTFCSPYSRRLEVVPIDHYYTLRTPTSENFSGMSFRGDGRPPEEFSIAFNIEKCRVVCKYEYWMAEGYKNGNEQNWQANRVEASLLYFEDALEEYTYYHVQWERVFELRRLLETLQNEGNVVFSSLHRNVGSDFHRAHARCYEFKEMLELVLKRGLTLHGIDLTSVYRCSISGSSFPNAM